MPDQVNLPGYRYDPALGQYVNLRTGRPISLSQLQALVDEQAEREDSYLLALLLLLSDGELAPALMASLSVMTLRRLYLQAAALGVGGWDNLDAETQALIEKEANSDVPRIMGTINDLAIGLISVAVARERFKAYIGRARSVFYQLERQRIQRPASNMLIIERRILGLARHCSSCVDHYLAGWQLEGVLPPPGYDSECGFHCRCRMVRHVIPAIDAPNWIGSRRGRYR